MYSFQLTKKLFSKACALKKSNTLVLHIKATCLLHNRSQIITTGIFHCFTIIATILHTSDVLSIPRSLLSSGKEVLSPRLTYARTCA